MRYLALAALAGLFAAGCTAGGGGAIDASVQDGTAVLDVSFDFPAGCPPAAANENGVGAACSKGGHECTGGTLRCTCDPISGFQLSGVPCVCTLAGLNTSPNNPDPCSTQHAGFCGSNATCCNYMTAGYFCSPNVCLPGGACIDFSASN
jgi:hypothetical protein